MSLERPPESDGLSPYKKEQRRAEGKAIDDFRLMRSNDAGRHGARVGSAWAAWYDKAYKAEQSTEEPG